MRKQYQFEAILLLLLIVSLAVMYLLIISTPQTVTGWEFQGTGRVQYMTIGENDTLYAFRSDGIYAIDRDGDLLWNYQVPQQWNILNTWQRPVDNTGTPGMTGTVESYPVSNVSAGHLYVFALPNVTAESLKQWCYQNRSPYLALDAAVLAISPDGTLSWELPINITIPTSEVMSTSDTSTPVLTRTVAIQATGDRVYVFHDYTETVVSATTGNILFEIPDVAEPGAVDENGHVYVVQAKKPDVISPSDPGSMVPSNVLEAYDTNGQQLWNNSYNEDIEAQHVAVELWPSFNTLPLYKNGTLYLLMDDYLVATDEIGKTKWWKSLPGSGPYQMFDLMPVDDQGDVYVRAPGSTSYLTVVGPDGWIHYAPWVYDSMYTDLTHTAARNGVIYSVDRTTFGSVDGLSDLQTLTVTAYDAKNSTALWSRTLPLDKTPTTVVLNSSNVGDILTNYPASNPMAQQIPGGITASRTVGMPDLSIYPGDDVIYVSFRSTNYEVPLVLNQSRATYSSSIYALNTKGDLIWQKQLTEPVTSAAANNSTIYYSISDGKIFGTHVNTVVAGIVFVALAAAFLKFFVFGTVTRGRGRVEKNDNRVAVLQYIVRNPGCTAVDIGRDMGLNVGTIRYHLLILAINHKIVEHKDDKYLRYFTNSNSYSMAERTVISLMKREPMWRVLTELAERPGLTNVEISRVLNISTGASSRHMGELFQKGIVTKTPVGDRGFAYDIKDEYRQYVVKMVAKL